jgi:hypothetical protein
MCFLQVITTKYGVFCKNECMLWFYAKQAPTYGVMCYFLRRRGRLGPPAEEVGMDPEAEHA